MASQVGGVQVIPRHGLVFPAGHSATVGSPINSGALHRTWQVCPAGTSKQSDRSYMHCPSPSRRKGAQEAVGHRAGGSNAPASEAAARRASAMAARGPLPPGAGQVDGGGPGEGVNRRPVREDDDGLVSVPMLTNQPVAPAPRVQASAATAAAVMAAPAPHILHRLQPTGGPHTVRRLPLPPPPPRPPPRLPQRERPQTAHAIAAPLSKLRHGAAVGVRAGSL